MDRFRGNIVTRLLAGIAFGVLFLAGGFFFVGKFLTRDLLIRQEFHFKIPEPYQEQFATQWAAFAREQQIQLLQLAQKKLPYLARYVSAIPQTKAPIITLKLRCSPEQDENIRRKFDELAANYALATLEARISRIKNKLTQIQMQILQLKAHQEKYMNMILGGRETAEPENPDTTVSKIIHDPIIHNDQRKMMEPSEILSSADKDFCAQLDLSKYIISENKTFSRFQQFVLVVFALGGFLLGIGPPGGYLHVHEQKSAQTTRELCRSITTASSEPAVSSFPTTINTATAPQAVATVPQKKRDRKSEQTILPVVERITVDEAGTAKERAEPESEPEVDIEVKPPTPRDREEHSDEKIKTITLVQPEENDIIAGEEPVSSESEESMVAPEQESIPVVAIDLNKDMPAAPAAGTPGAARSKYDTLADLIEKLRPQVRCPVIAVSALKPRDVSPRLTVNLAVALIRRALRVLIVDADPSNKELATLFGLPEEPGFFEWRRGAAWISHTTHRTQLVGLSVMPAGIPNEPQKNPDLELWREKHRWGNLSNDFDVVLLYYPSALAVDPQTPEQIIGVHLRNLAHGVLALTRSTKQVEKSAQNVVDNLADHTAQLLAMVPIKT
jgi:Mrp family chromosome partitioning ATPase